MHHPFLDQHGRLQSRTDAKRDHHATCVVLMKTGASPTTAPILADRTLRMNNDRHPLLD